MAPSSRPLTAEERLMFEMGRRAVIKELAPPLRAYVLAQSRMADRWAEGDEAVRRDLWRNLHACEQPARDALERIALSEGKQMADEMPTSTLTDTLGGEVLRDGSTLYTINVIGLNYWWATLMAAGRESAPPEKHEAMVEAMRAALNGHDALKAENEKLRAELAKAERKFEICRHNIDRWLPCPDHRDKTERGHCLPCEIERLRAALQQVVDLDGDHLNDSGYYGGTYEAGSYDAFAKVAKIARAALTQERA